jgi:hypothetical protein
VEFVHDTNRSTGQAGCQSSPELSAEL